MQRRLNYIPILNSTEHRGYRTVQPHNPPMLLGTHNIAMERTRLALGPSAFKVTYHFAFHGNAFEKSRAARAALASYAQIPLLGAVLRVLPQLERLALLKSSRLSNFWRHETRPGDMMLVGDLFDARRGKHRGDGSGSRVSCSNMPAVDEILESSNHMRVHWRNKPATANVEDIYNVSTRTWVNNTRREPTEDVEDAFNSFMRQWCKPVDRKSTRLNSSHWE